MDYMYLHLAFSNFLIGLIGFLIEHVHSQDEVYCMLISQLPLILDMSIGTARYWISNWRGFSFIILFPSSFKSDYIGSLCSP